MITEATKQLSLLMETDATVRKLMLNATTDYTTTLEATVVALATKLQQMRQIIEEIDPLQI